MHIPANNTAMSWPTNQRLILMSLRTTMKQMSSEARYMIQKRNEPDVSDGYIDGWIIV